MRPFALFLCLMALPASADDWPLLSGDGVREALEGRVLVYDSGARQDFRASGRTLYNAGQDSWGYWAVRENRYCSQWPPSDLWACYGVAKRGDAIRFVGAAGDISEGRYAD